MERGDRPSQTCAASKLEQFCASASDVMIMASFPGGSTLSYFRHSCAVALLSMRCMVGRGGKCSGSTPWLSPGYWLSFLMTFRLERNATLHSYQAATRQAQKA